MAEVFVATTSAIVDYGGTPQRIRKGVTRVEAGHDLLTRYPEYFQPAGEGVRFPIEDAKDRSVQRSPRARKAAAEPEPNSGPTVGLTTADAEPSQSASGAYAEWTVDDLKAEIRERNADRDEDAQVAAGGKGNKADLVAALEADDQQG